MARKQLRDRLDTVLVIHRDNVRLGRTNRQSSARKPNSLYAILDFLTTDARVQMLLYVDSQYTSPYAMSVFVGLKEKRIPFELRTVDLDSGANHSAEYATRSLTERVPTLLDGEFALSESSAITEYLDEVYPGIALYPSDPRAKARARQVQAWLRSDLMPIRQERSTNVVFYEPSQQPLSPAAQIAARKLFRTAEALLAHDGEYLFGSWSIADVDLTLMLNRLILNNDAVPSKLADYAGRQWQRSSVQAWVNQVRPEL